ncbi:MAG TPA: flagellar basal body L-ring protein FlgH [Bryobacteraceae bacterium]|nr:flagellar basal body L-ring protein FlgH [Bryobacteraceae bacterium]
MMRTFKALVCCAMAASVIAAKQKQPQESALDRIIREAGGAGSAITGAAGSLWTPASPFNHLGADLRPRQLHDLVTVVVLDRASAIARGSVKSARAASASGGVQSIVGTPPGGNRLKELLSISGESNLDGAGETTRETVLRTSLSARVTHVLPNGLLVVEGQKAVRVNAETQVVTVRGLLRPVDVGFNNSIFSDQLAELEVSVNGKGVVGDAVRRPHFLYRLLLGVLPF